VKCYNHPDRNAVGVCTVCKRGVCGDCEVILEGRHYCKEHAEKRLVREERTAGLQERGIPITLASLLAVFSGLAGVVVGFLLIIIGLLGPSAQSSSILSTTLGPFLNYFQAVSAYPPDQTLLVGLVAFLSGSVGIGAGYFLWRRSKNAAMLSVALAIFGEILVATYLEVLALAGAFTFLHVTLAIVRIFLIAFGWKHLK
jgi:hypothetical protein